MVSLFMSCKTKLRQGDKVYCELSTGKARFEDQFRLVEIFKNTNDNTGRRHLLVKFP